MKTSSFLAIVVAAEIAGLVYGVASTAQACSAGGNSVCLTNAASGRVITAPKIYVVFWGFNSSNDPLPTIPSANDLYRSFGSSRYLNIVTQYTDASGAPVVISPNFYAGSASPSGDLWFDPSQPVCTYPSPAQCTAGCGAICNGVCITNFGLGNPWDVSNDNEVQNAVNYFGRQYDPNALFVVFTRNTNQPCGFAASHGYTKNNSDGFKYPYALIPYQGSLAGLDVALMHEVMEMITDPIGDGWHQDKTGLELGDIAQVSPCSSVFACQTPGGCQLSNTTQCGRPSVCNEAFGKNTGTCSGFPFQVEPMSASASYFSQGFWSQAANTISGVSSTVGEVYARSTQLFQYVTGSGHIWQAAANTESYSAAWYAVPNMPTNVSVVGDVASASWSPNRIDLFALNGTASLYHSVWDGSGWSWEPFPLPDVSCTYLTNPDLASVRPGSLTVTITCHKTDATWHVYVKNYTPSSGWGVWQDLGVAGGGLSWGGPSITSWGASGGVGSERLDLFVRRSDGVLLHSASNNGGSTWTGFDSRGAPPDGAFLVGDPDSASWGSNRIDVVISSINGKVQHLAWDGNNWNWDYGGLNGYGGPAGVSFGAGPSIAALGDNRLWVSAVDTSGGVWNAKYDFGWNSAWFHPAFATSGAGIESTSW